MKFRILHALSFLRRSLPVRGAWVEIHPAPKSVRCLMGRSPCGERGLKSIIFSGSAICFFVAPRAGSVG